MVADHCAIFIHVGGDYKIKVTFDPLICLVSKLWWHPTLYRTKTQIKKFELNNIGVLHGHQILE